MKWYILAFGLCYDGNIVGYSIHTAKKLVEIEEEGNADKSKCMTMS